MSKRSQVNYEQPEKLRLSKVNKRTMSEDSGELQSEREY